jgi:hypothetical protein
MTAFGKALSAMFGDANMGEAALYREKGVGAGVAIRAARYRPSGASGFGQSEIISEGEQIEVRQADTPHLGAGDTFEIAGVLWQVVGDPERGGLDLTWIVPIREAY